MCVFFFFFSVFSVFDDLMHHGVSWRKEIRDLVWSFSLFLCAGGRGGDLFD